jgi:hypothetical protein
LNRFCAVANTGTGNRVMTSTDGSNWQTRTSPADNSWRGICWSPELGMFCAVANVGTGRVASHFAKAVYTSSDNIADTGWFDIDQNTLDATTSIFIEERPENSQASLTYQYALNNGELNGSWLTLAHLNEALSLHPITDHANSMKIQSKLHSGGDEFVEIVVGSYAQASGLTGGSSGGGNAGPWGMIR